MRTMINDILVATGRFDIVGEAITGLDAVEKFGKLCPDLIIMDIVMPEMDGIAATREIMKQNPKMKIVICSALGQESLVIESIAAGAREFLVKPFDSTKVVEVIDYVLQTG